MIHDAQKETSPTPPTPNLALSRENTPYLDDHDPQETGPNSEASSSAEEGEPSANLDLSRAKLKRTLDAPVRRDLKRKVIKGIEKLWVHPDHKTLAAISKLSTISVNLIAELLKESSNPKAKTIEAERILSTHWTSDTGPKSFLARLKMTKLPLLKTLHVRARGSLDEPVRALDIQLITERHSALVDQLNEELKELQKLETYYKSANALYEKDQKHLSELRASSATQRAQLSKEIQENMVTFKLHKDPIPAKQPECNEKAREARSGRRFDPAQDPDVSSLLHELNRSLGGMDRDIFKMQEYVNHLSVLEQPIQDHTQKQKLRRSSST